LWQKKKRVSNPLAFCWSQQVTLFGGTLASRIDCSKQNASCQRPPEGQENHAPWLDCSVSGWWLTYPTPLKNMTSSTGIIVPNIKNVPNHQPG